MTKITVSDKVNVKVDGKVTQGEIMAVHADGVIDVSFSEPVTQQVEDVQEPHRKKKGLQKSSMSSVETSSMEGVPHASSMDIEQKEAGQSIAVWFCRKQTEKLNPSPADPEVIEVLSA